MSDFHEPYDGDLDEVEEQLSNCDYVPGEGCSLVGSEYCDWECRVREDLEEDEREP